jgi:hypothetical protein
MSNYKRKEVMDYLTRKPVTTQDIELARTRIQPPVTPAPMQVTSNEELGTQLELAAGGVVERENYKLGSDFIKDVYEANKISGIRVKKADSGNIYIAGRYTDKDGQRVTTGTKTFNPKTATQKEVTDFLNQTKRQLKGKTYSSATEAILGTSKAKLDYTELRKEYVNDLMEWLDEASKNSKYKTREQIQKDLFKQFNQPKYTEVPKGVHNKSIFFQDGKFSIPRETEIFGRKLGPQKVPEKTINDLSDFFLLKNNPNFEKVRDAAYGFFTQKEADINKYPAEKQKILRNFSREFIKGQFKGEAGESLFLSGLRQEGFNFNNKVNEIFYIQSLKDKITEELSNPNISNNRKNFLNKQLEAINYQKTNITRNLTKLHPNLFRAAKNPGNLVYEHKVPRFIQDMVNLPYDYLARASFAPNALNVYKFEQFDKPLGRLITEYNSTSDATIKNEIKNKIENLKNTFNEKTKVKGQGYLDEVEFKFGNKVKLIDNTPLISDLTNKNVYENILRNIDHSNKFFEKEGLNKYIVKGKDFEKYTKDLQNRISINKGAYYSFPAQVSESTLLGTLAGKTKDVFSNAYSAYKFTGGPINTLIGGILNAPEMEEKGLSLKESFVYGGIKGTIEDTLNFGAQILAAGPLMQKTLLEAAQDAKQQPPAGIDSFDQTGGKQSLQSKFFNELFSVQPFDISEIPVIGSTWLAERKPVKEKIDNLVNLETRKKMAELYPSPNISETEAPEQNNIMQQQEQEIKKNLYQEYFENPEIKKEYEKEEIKPVAPKKPLFLGPIVITPDYTQEEKKVVYNQKENNTEEPKDNLYIPPLAKKDPSIREGVLNLAFGGRVNFSGGGIKIARLISDVLLDLKNSIHIVGNTARFQGIQKAKLEALTPYRNIPDQSKHTTILESINKARQNLPKEYHSILDDIKKDVDNFDYATADNRIMALDKTVAPELKFESLSKDLFPMEDPLNSAFIIMDPQRNNMKGRFVHSVRIDPETGRGTRETFDTFDSKTRTFLKREDWKPMGVESIEKGKEGLN